MPMCKAIDQINPSFIRTNPAKTPIINCGITSKGINTYGFIFGD
jgi:hypothetical protein